jgi:hypothetical protein
MNSALSLGAIASLAIAGAAGQKQSAPARGAHQASH